MKKKLLYIVMILGIVTISACKKDLEKEQAVNDVFYPKIFGETAQFPLTARTVNGGDTVKFSNLLFTPANKVTISWKVNDKEVATTPDFNFVTNVAGDYIIKLEISYQGQTSSRSTEVLVNSTQYTHKPYTSIAMSYLSENGAAANVNWANVTHVTYKVGTVTPAGILDVSKGEVSGKAVELAARGHINGVPVLLGVSGELSEDGWAVYPSNDFGAAVNDATKRAALVASIKAYLALKKMDGVDIMMADINSTTPQINAAIAGTKVLLDDLRAALPSTALITVTVTSNYYYSRYPDLSGADWVNLHAFEDEEHVGPNAPVGASSSYDYMVTTAEQWKAKLSAKKIVVGIPAMGLRYLTLNASGNNLGWTSYNYIAYKDILALDATASNKDFLDSSQGIYFNGVPLVTKKAAYIKANGFGGAYLWAGDYDVLDDHSLMRAIYKALN